jgi:hypothetical protein
LVADFKREGVRSTGLNLIQAGSDGLQNPEELLVARQIQSMSKTMINVFIVQGKQVEGIVGMASHVNIISDKFYNSLPNKPVKLDEFTLFTADTYMSMKGYLLEPTEIKISDLLFNKNTDAAPLGEAMQIGLDFMSKLKTTLNINECYTYIQGQQLSFIDIKVNNSVLAVRKTEVMIQKKSQIPPRSVLNVPCSADHRHNNGLFLIEPTVNLVLSLRSDYSRTIAPVKYFTNNTSNMVTLSENQQAGYEHEGDEIPPVTETSGNLRILNVSKVLDQPNIIEHLNGLHEKSCYNLIEIQDATLRDLLPNYGKACPIKWRLRRTRTCFAGEEKKQIEKMLQLDVNMIEWTSSPALVKKHLKQVDPGVCAINHTRPLASWLRQDEVIKKILGIPMADRSLILNLRDPIGNVHGTEVTPRCRGIIRETSNRTQHSYENGGRS